MEPKAAVEEASKKLQIKLKNKQEEAVLAVLNKRDAFTVLPTGYGKSIIYGILPLAFDFLLGEYKTSCVI